MTMELVKMDFSEGPVVMDYETFAAINGASRASIGEAALHMSSRNKSPNTHRRQVRAQARADHDVIIRRGELQVAYDELVADGKLRPLTALESSVRTANGHPDNMATQAARRVLTRKGYDWKTGEKLADNRSVSKGENLSLFHI